MIEAIETAMREANRCVDAGNELLALAHKVAPHSVQGAADILEDARDEFRAAGKYVQRAYETALDAAA